MSINNNPYNFLNTPVLDAMRKLQKTSALTAVHELQAQMYLTFWANKKSIPPVKRVACGTGITLCC